MNNVRNIRESLFKLRSSLESRGCHEQAVFFEMLEEKSEEIEEWCYTVRGVGKMAGYFDFTPDEQEEVRNLLMEVVSFFAAMD